MPRPSHDEIKTLSLISAIRVAMPLGAHDLSIEHLAIVAHDTLVEARRGGASMSFVMNNGDHHDDFSLRRRPRNIHVSHKVASLPSRQLLASDIMVIAAHTASGEIVSAFLADVIAKRYAIITHT